MMSARCYLKRDFCVTLHQADYNGGRSFSLWFTDVNIYFRSSSLKFLYNTICHSTGCL